MITAQGLMESLSEHLKENEASFVINYTKGKGWHCLVRYPSGGTWETHTDGIRTMQEAVDTLLRTIHWIEN